MSILLNLNAYIQCPILGPILVYRYLLVRYEDFAALPKVKVELVYRWSGRGEPPAVISRWIDNNTKMSNCDPPAEHGNRRFLTVDGDNLLGTNNRQNAHYPLTRSHERQVRRMLQPTSNNNTGRVGGDGEGVGTDGGGGGGSNNLRGVDARKSAPYSLLSTNQEEVLRLIQPMRNNVNNNNRGDEVRRMLQLGSNKTSNHRGKYSEASDGGASGGSVGGGADGASDGGGGGGGCSPARSKNPFSTRRHSADMVDQWRTQMTKEHAEVVWEECVESNVMAELGYEH